MLSGVKLLPSGFRLFASPLGTCVTRDLHLGFRPLDLLLVSNTGMQATTPFSSFTRPAQQLWQGSTAKRSMLRRRC